ncbi:ABC transporter permease [Paenibacillus sp. MY03]|jgi:putative aldouronate transport system permease protein|uniref:carbohydrate ABC transporter permease n=1 Tax=Paenibacillus sp. MY03 TaxID=302980 RepID=UPI000B3C69EC|nr:carbohydrate ABC transporter permease [Paenibacillus sp. MY03]OUS78154.1 ABC transporter permease [Paenibacillus sp. MY03]
MKISVGDKIFNTANIILLGLAALVTLFPIYYVLIVSFTDPAEFVRKTVVLWPEKWSLVSYRYLLSAPPFIRAIGVSAFLAIVGTFCSLLITSSFAYSLSRKKFKGRKAILMFVLFTILFGPGIIPNYLLVKELGLINSLWAVILVSLTSGWYVILMKGFYDSLPDALVEAASIDGCNDITAWFKIILPLSLPSIAAFGLFFAVANWNQFFNALLYLNDSSKWPIQVLLQNMLIDSSSSSLGDVDPLIKPPPSTQLKMAAVVIAITPIICVYPFLQKHFAKGVMIGSVKG